MTEKMGEILKYTAVLGVIAVLIQLVFLRGDLEYMNKELEEQNIGAAMVQLYLDKGLEETKYLYAGIEGETEIKGAYSKMASMGEWLNQESPHIIDQLIKK